MQSKKLGFTASVPFALFAAWLIAFALPVSAASKSISLSVTPSTLTSATTTVSAKITNTGNSSANSFEIDWTSSPDFTVTAASAGGTAGACSPSGIAGTGYSGCVFLKQVPTKSSVTVTLTVQVANQCTPLSIGWLAYAWTGSPGSVSQSFAMQPAGPVVTSSTPNCSIQFVTQPKDAFIGSTITGTALNSTAAPVRVQVQQYGAGVATTVSLSASPTTCAAGPASVTTDSSGIAEVAFTAAGSTASSCALTAAATGYGSVDSQSFQVVPAGQLGCDETNNNFTTSGAGGLTFTGVRLENVNDPSPTAVGGFTAPACVVVPYVVSTTCPTGFTGACTDFVYDPLDQGTHMAFHFTWAWPIEGIPDGGIDAIPETMQLFINGNLVPVDLDLCPHSFAVYDVSGDFVKLVPDPAYTGPYPHPQDQDTIAPGTQAGCLIDRHVIQDGSSLKLVEDAWVQGDYAARRN
jgi:hypothetical protein